MATLSDGREYTFRPCVKGQLLEINRRFESEPGLLCARTHSDGYLAIVHTARSGEVQLAAGYRLLTAAQFERRERRSCDGADGSGEVRDEDATVDPGMHGETGSHEGATRATADPPPIPNGIVSAPRIDARLSWE